MSGTDVLPELPEIMKREHEVCLSELDRKLPRKADILGKGPGIVLFGGTNDGPAAAGRCFEGGRNAAATKGFYRNLRWRGMVYRCLGDLGETDFLVRVAGKVRVFGNSGRRSCCEAIERDANGDPQKPKRVFHAAKVDGSLSKPTRPRNIIIPSSPPQWPRNRPLSGTHHQ